MKILKNSTKDLKYIFSEDHIYNCKTIEKFSKMTNENLSSLLEFIFIIIVKEMLQGYNLLSSKSNLDPTPSFGLSDDIDLLSSINDTKASITNKSGKKGKKSKSTSLTDVDEFYDGELGDDVEEGEDLFSGDFITTNNNEVYNLIYDILININTNTKNTDKFTQFNISENIEKKSDTEKENNLKFIEDLDKESRQALKTMIVLGIDTWKDLASKTDKELFFDNTNSTQANELNEFNELNPSNDELNEINRSNAMEELGENMSDHQYQEWLDEYNRNNQENLLQSDEADVMPDDDGDEGGLDDDFDGDY
tara:strand:+ start:96 stop:1019 length:924 start_codon:yes stop_codon:yes gene_type:complete